ncbi:hypothetical protein [Pseudomonas sp. PLMAX]|uniref:hypothetical protein n=1 Tax=Pseudomonas sp. PLMAX TaxID=2201998 RepID=UPI0038BC8AE0
MSNWLGRNRGAFVFALTLLMVLLGLANAWKHDLVSVQWLREQKDTLAALNSAVTIALLIAGAMFSYYRFFRGRTLSLRLELSIDVSVHETPLDKRLHAITVTAKNVGTSTVWNPHPALQIRIHGPSEAVWNINEWQSVDGQTSTLSVIESGEATTFFALKSISKEAWAVTYTASVKADEGDTWFVSKTISNRTGGHE